ncbi:MAG: ABC transporter ATP-binding protein [Hyphomicrobiales bacterium]|nr:ABC transporter ATP-binding protein [Hyphomicrobiales bacterium]
MSSTSSTSPDGPASPVIDIQGLELRFPGESGPVTVIDKVDLTIGTGEILGLVGESGCGKSMLARSIMRLIPVSARVTGGRVLFEGQDLLTIDESEMRRIRGNRIAIILQEPMTSLNPVFTVGNQITEVLSTHQPGLKPEERKKRAIEMMERIGIQFPAHRFSQYPHELSGGIRQRVMIAIALIGGNVGLLVADEPTTALDVTIQAQILELFVRLQAEQRMALLLITHDLSVVAQTAHRVAVMYAGRLVEIADVISLFENPLHPYTLGLMNSLPRPGDRPRKSHMDAIPGTVPNLANLPPGCQFFDRCEHRRDEPCLNTMPQLEETADGHWVRCHRWRDIQPSSSAMVTT